MVILEEKGEEEEDPFVIAFHQWGCDALEKCVSFSSSFSFSPSSSFLLLLFYL